MIICYSYVRFSSKKQQLGNSFKRQTKAAEEICKEKNWQLDSSEINILGTTTSIYGATINMYGDIYMPGIVQTQVYGYDLVCSQSEKKVGWYSSSIRYKENVRDAKTDWFSKIRIRMFDRKGGMKGEYGVIA
jgi:hypothetical protein